MTLKLRFDSMQIRTMKLHYLFLNIETINGYFQLVITKTYNAPQVPTSYIHWRKYKHATIYIEQFIIMPQLLFSMLSGVKMWPRFVLMNSRGGDFDGQINLNYYKQFWKMHLYILHLSFSLFRCWCKVSYKHWMRTRIVYFVNPKQGLIVVYI